jgi:PKD repeat protein
VQEGDSVIFNGSTDANLDAPGTFVLWDFGDGSTAIDTLTPAHTYADNGDYTVTLLVKDASGRSGSDTLTVDVSNADPVVGIAPTMLVTKAGQPVTLHGWFADPGSDDSHTILWDFGPGQTTSGTLAPSHVFPAEGSYIVELQVTDDDGGSGSTTASVVAWVDEICDGVDNDLDGQTDEGWDANMNGISDCVDPELNTDGDDLANDLDEDDDGDSFRDDYELYMGTDPLDACPDNADDPAWPLDMDNDTDADIFDVMKYVGIIGVTPPVYVYRLDLDTDGDVDMFDVLKFVGTVGVPGKDTCSNP